MIELICLQVTILFVWYKTDAFVEYIKYLPKDIFKVKAYIIEKDNNDMTLTYHNYLKQFNSGFFVRLITCPICLNIWLSIICSYFISIYLMPVMFIISMFTYYLLCKAQV